MQAETHKMRIMSLLLYTNQSWFDGFDGPKTVKYIHGLVNIIKSYVLHLGPNQNHKHRISSHALNANCVYTYNKHLKTH
jgi:hypothetical protein